MILRKLRLPSTLTDEISLNLILGITSLRRSPVLTRTSVIFLLANSLKHIVSGLSKETLYLLSRLFRDIIDNNTHDIVTGLKLTGRLNLTWKRGTRVTVNKYKTTYIKTANILLTVELFSTCCTPLFISKSDKLTGLYPINLNVSKVRFNDPGVLIIKGHT